MIHVQPTKVIAAATDGSIVHLECYAFSSDLQRRRALAGYTSALPPGVKLLSRPDVRAVVDDGAVHCAECGEVI